MKTVTGWFYRQVAIALAMLMAAPFGVAAAPPPQQAPPMQQASAASEAPPPPENVTATDTNSASLPDSPAPIPAQSGDPQQGSSAQATTQQQSPPSTMGTAAAPAEPASGIAASKPAGAAIAPARQKRTRSFVIKMSLLIGAAVAIGTVVALSSASPSRP